MLKPRIFELEGLSYLQKNLRNTVNFSPETRLILAIVEQAAKDYGSNDKDLHTSAKEYFMDTTFAYHCALLKVSAKLFREKYL